MVDRFTSEEEGCGLGLLKLLEVLDVHALQPGPLRVAELARRVESGVGDLMPEPRRGDLRSTVLTPSDSADAGSAAPPA